MTNFDHGFSSDLLWKTLWDSTNDGLIVINLEGNVVACNSAMEKMIGINLLGMSLTEMFEATGIRYTEDGILATVEDLVATRALRGEKSIQKRWFQRNTAKPEGYYTDNTGHTLRDENGEISGAFVIIRDVTDFVLKEQEAQRNYEKMLRESEVLWEAIPDLVFRISKDEVYLDFRFPKSEDLIAPQMEVVGTRIGDHLNDDYGALTICRNAIRDALETGKLQTIEYVLMFPDGLRYFEARLVPNGTEEVVSIVRNVSAQKESQQLMLESEQRYRTLLEAFPGILFRMSMDGQFLDVHTNDEEILFAPKNILLGNWIHKTHPEDSVRRWEELRDALKKTGLPQNSEADMTINGRVKTFNQIMVSFGKDELLLVILDITQHSMAKQELKESESRFRSIAEAMTNPLLISRLSDGIILYVNQRLYDALKLRNTDLVGKPTPDFYAHPEQRQKLLDALKKQGHVYDWEMELIRPNGEHFWVSFSASTINYDGEAALIASYVDITERQIVQAQLLQASKMATLGEMSAGVAHEINTPLATIRLSSHNVQQAWKTKNYAELKKNLDLIDDEVHRTSTIIRQMLDFSRNAEQDKWVLVDVSKTIEQIMYMLKRQLESEGIEIILKLSRQPLYVEGNPTQLQQVFYNLAANAKDALKTSVKRKLEFRIKRRKTKAIFEIEDSGEGISPKDLPNIFEPFFTTKALGMGTGLGLSVSDNIVKNHHGSIECKSKGPGKGTLFRVILPLKEN